MYKSPKNYVSSFKQEIHEYTAKSRPVGVTESSPVISACNETATKVMETSPIVKLPLVKVPPSFRHTVVFFVVVF